MPNAPKNTTKNEAIRLVTKALEDGHTIHVRAYGNDITAGPYHPAVQPAFEKFAAFNYSKYAKEQDFYAARAFDVAFWVVEHVGRGAAGKVARKALAQEVV